MRPRRQAHSGARFSLLFFMREVPFKYTLLSTLLLALFLDAQPRRQASRNSGYVSVINAADRLTVSSTSLLLYHLEPFPLISLELTGAPSLCATAPPHWHLSQPI